MQYANLHSVSSYCVKSASLTLEHNYPPGNKSKVVVDVELLVNTLKSNETQIGEWVNVIGYIQTPQQKPTKLSNDTYPRTRIQAIVLWSSGPLKLDGYEKSLEQQKADRTNLGSVV